MPKIAPTAEPLDGDFVWSLILEVRRRIKAGGTLPARIGVGRNARGLPAIVSPARDTALIVVERGGRWTTELALSDATAQLLDLYLPVCHVGRDSRLVIAHLGQTVDGRIATEDGDSFYVTGRKNIVHLHRMRALCDAVLVGAETARRDDPALTTRLVPGDSPVRVVLDPRRTLSAAHGLLRDGAASTLVVHGGVGADDGTVGAASVIPVPLQGTRLDLPALLDRLTERGLRSVFVEGGGATVSAFLAAGLLDRLHIAVAPILLGSGRMGIDLPIITRMGEALTPPHRRFAMGDDVLYDFDLRGAA